MLNFVYLRSSRLKVLHFWLNSCISNKGEKFELEMACQLHLESFQVVLSHFWALVCTGLTGKSAGPVHVLHTGLIGGVDLSDQSGLSCCSYPVSSGVLHAFVQGELACLQGELFVVFRALVWWFALFA
jgi:hypothetical protein